jgi:hypothetical protein
MASSIQVQLEEAVVTTIKGLDLSGIPDANVQREVAIGDDKTEKAELPCVRVSCEGRELIDPAKGTNKSDDYGYPVLVVIIDKMERDPLGTSPADREQYWRERVIDAFLNKRVSGVTGSYMCNIEPLDQRMLGKFLVDGLWVSAVIIRAWVRRTRS